MRWIKDSGKRILVLTIASVLMAINIKSFVHTGGLFPGGATGLTVLIQRVSEMFFGVTLPFTVVNTLLNLGPIYIGFRFIGKQYTLYSVYMIMLTNVLTDLMPEYIITYDVLLISIFGGMINGAVISMCLLAKATSGGTDFIGIYLSQKKGTDSFGLVLGINGVILGCAGLLFGWDKALYSIIFQYVSTEMIHIMYREFQQTTLFIVTDKPNEIVHLIARLCNHGATLIDAEGGFLHQRKQMVMSVVQRSDCNRVTKAIRELDGNAFISVTATDRVAGRFYHRPYK